MVSLVAVVDESGGIAETSLGVLLNLAAINYLGQSNPRYRYPPSVEVLVLDLPALVLEDTTDPKFYAVGYCRDAGADWSGADLEVSYDGGTTFQKHGSRIEDQGTVGFAVVQASDRNLGDARPGRWDVYSKLTVRLWRGELESKTRAQVLAGENMLYVGGEIRAFTTATELQDATTPTSSVNPAGAPGRLYELTDWMRCMLGTSAHAPVEGDAVVHLNAPMAAVVLPSGDDEVPLSYRARDAVSDQDFPGRESTLYGENLRPRGPANVEVTQDATTSDWSVQFSRVTRDPAPQILGYRGVTDYDTPAFTIEVMSDGTDSATVKRTLAYTEATPVAGAPVYESSSYTDAQQNEDFGSTQTELYVRVTWAGSWTDSTPETFSG